MIALLSIFLLIYRGFRLTEVVIGNCLEKKTSKQFPITTVTGVLTELWEKSIFLCVMFFGGGVVVRYGLVVV